MFRMINITATLLTITILINETATQTLDEIKDKIVNDWKSIALELVPQQQGDQVYPEYQRRAWNFTTSSEFSTLIENFDDKSGQNRKLTIQGQGEITYQGSSDVISGSYLCQFNFSKSAIITLHTDQLVTAFNAAQQGQDGITWVKDKPQDITKAGVPALQKQTNQFFQSYDLIYIRDDFLYMGEVDVFGTEASLENPPKGLCSPLIPFSDDETPLTLDELKNNVINGVWSSLTKEVRPGLNTQGKLITTFQTRKISFLSAENFSLVLTSYPGPGQTSSFLETEVFGLYEWQEEASSVVQGAYFAKFTGTQMYLTPLSDEMAAGLNQGLPTGMDPFKNGQKANITGKNLPAFGMTNDSPSFEDDMVYLKQNRLFLQARPVDGGMLSSIEKRTYSLQRDLINPELSSFQEFLIFNFIILLIF